METNVQTSQNIEIVTKKEITIRKVLNIYGVFAVIGLLLSIFTNPISLNENMQVYFNEEIMMEPKKVKEFLLFIFLSSSIFFFLVNIYFIGQIGRKVVLTILFLLGCFCIFMAFYLGANSIPH